MKRTYAGEATQLQNEAMKQLFDFDVNVEEKSVTVKNQPFELVVFDTETSGLDFDKDRVVQFSAIKFNCEDGKLSEKDRLDLFINQPEYDENKMAGNITFKELTDISNEFLKTQPTEPEAFEKIFAFLGDNPILCAHNTPFDWGMIVPMYIRNGKNCLTPPTHRLDTLVLARDLVSKEDAPKEPGKDGKEKPTYKLSALASLFGIDKSEEDDDKDIRFHNSMNDVVVTGRLFEVLIYEYAQRLLKETLEEVNRPEVKKERAVVKSISFWEGYRGFSRIYVNAQIRGGLAGYFYDIRGKRWGEREEGTILGTDMESFIKDAFDLAKVSSEEEFAKIRGEIKADEAFLARYN